MSRGILMQTEPDFSTIAALIGEPTRATILAALLNGQSLPASELAYRAHITCQTASSHLAKLVAGGLLEVNKAGRHRYYRLKNANVARALEALAVISPPNPIQSHRDSAKLQALRFARTCYDHLAGQLGVAITHALEDKNFLLQDDGAYTLTEAGSAWLARWNIDENQLRKERRAFARTCLDWSERHDHLAGALGTALTTMLFDRGYIHRVPDSRAVRLTDAGRLWLQQELSINYAS